MKRHDAGTDEFIQQFNDFPHQRQNIIESFIKDRNRLLLNIPRGPARLISARLREGPFSVFYEFEKGLARTLHPFIAGLNLNVIADILVNSLFSEKYRFYARDINYILASNKELEPDALKSVVLKMIERDGHYMVVKFYDLVLRLIDVRLYREMKPVELCIIEMKKNLGESAADNAAAIAESYDTFRKNHGDKAAMTLSVRARWDGDLKNYFQDEQETDPTGIARESSSGASPEDETPSGIGGKETGPGAGSHSAAGASEEEVPWEERISRYAALIKENYLIKKEPSDEPGIRDIIEGMAVKNERISGPERAVDIVHEVLALWIEDDALDDIIRETLIKIRAERQGLLGVQDEPSPEPVPQETLPMKESGPMAVEPDEADAGAVEEEKAREAARAEDDSEPAETGVSDEEMSAILEGISDDTAEHEEPSAAAAVGEMQEQGVPEQGDDETFLISDDEIREMAEGTSRPETGRDDSFLIGQEEAADEVPDTAPDEATEKASADQDFIEEMIAADEFVIQDELLYEDRSLKKKQKKEKKPDDK